MRLVKIGCAQFLGQTKLYNLKMINRESLNQTILTESDKKSAFGFWLAIGVGLILLTQITRYLVKYFNFPIYENNNFAFSLNVPPVIMIGLYLLAVLFIGHHLYYNWYRLYAVSRLGFTLIISGGLGNLMERIIYGHVVDYFFITNGVLNLADFFIMAGIIFIFVQREYKSKP